MLRYFRVLYPFTLELDGYIPAQGQVITYSMDQIIRAKDVKKVSRGKGGFRFGFPVKCTDGLYRYGYTHSSNVIETSPC